MLQSNRNYRTAELSGFAFLPYYHKIRHWYWAMVLLIMFIVSGCVSKHANGTIPLTTSTYDPTRCVHLKNEAISVVIDPANGCRIIEYAYEGKNIMAVEPENSGWIYPDGNKYLGPNGGRFDVGPEDTISDHPELWEGEWKIVKQDPLSVTCVSPESVKLGIRLEREFSLNSDDSSLSCRQTVTNISATPMIRNLWSRTFVNGGGISILPLSQASRFPRRYVLYTSWPLFHVVTRPADEKIQVRDDYVLIAEPPSLPKVGVESFAGWFAYLSPQNLLLIKSFPVYPERRYGTITGSTVELYFYQNKLVELEAIGPEEHLEPGQSASFAETWQLLPYAFSSDLKSADLATIKSLAD